VCCLVGQEHWVLETSQIYRFFVLSLAEVRSEECLASNFTGEDLPGVRCFGVGHIMLSRSTTRFDGSDECGSGDNDIA